MKGTYNKKKQCFIVQLQKEATKNTKGFLGFGGTNKPLTKEIPVPDSMKDMFKDGQVYNVPRITPDTRN